MTEEKPMDSALESKALIEVEKTEKKQLMPRSTELARIRQRAYRERMKDRGLRELRLLLPPEEHESIRRLTRLFSNGDDLVQSCAASDYHPRSSWIPRWWPWYSLQRQAAFLLLTIVLGIGALAGALIQREIDLAGAHATASLLPDLRQKIIGLEVERANLLARLEGIRTEAARTANYQTDIRATLQSISLGVGQLGASLNKTRQQKVKNPTPPGPRLVPLRGGKPADHRQTTLMKLGLYRFQEGDSLESVAKRFGIKIADMQEVNQRLRPEPWRIGDYIAIPLTNQEMISLTDRKTIQGQKSSQQKLSEKP